MGMAAVDKQRNCARIIIASYPLPSTTVILGADTRVFSFEGKHFCNLAKFCKCRVSRIISIGSAPSSCAPEKLVMCS